jgi:hypothetical protein
LGRARGAEKHLMDKRIRRTVPLIQGLGRAGGGAHCVVTVISGESCSVVKRVSSSFIGSSIGSSKLRDKKETKSKFLREGTVTT